MSVIYTENLQEIAYFQKVTILLQSNRNCNRLLTLERLSCIAIFIFAPSKTSPSIMQIYTNKVFNNPIETIETFDPQKVQSALDRIESLQRLGY